jgi:amidase
MRVAAWLDDPAAPVGDAVARVLANATDALRAAGFTIEDDARPRPRLAELVDLWRTFTLPMHAAFTLDETVYELACAHEATPRADDENSGALSLRAIAARHRDWLVANEKRHVCLAQFAEFFESYDALITPVVGIPAFPHDHDNALPFRTIDVNGVPRPHTDVLTWPSAFGAIWLPAATVPVGFTDDGLPVGMQIVGPYVGDRAVLAVAASVEEVLGGFRPPAAFVS